MANDVRGLRPRCFTQVQGAAGSCPLSLESFASFVFHPNTHTANDLGERAGVRGLNPVPPQPQPSPPQHRRIRPISIRMLSPAMLRGRGGFCRTDLFTTTRAQPTDIVGQEFLAAQRRQRGGCVRFFGRLVEGDAWKSDEHGARDRVPAFAAARLVIDERPYPSADADG